jgi:putative hydrolase of the HAD superfamily
MALRALFLDVGNTLLREEPSRFELYARAARARGVAIDERAMAGLMRRAHGELPQEIGGAWRYTDPWFERYIERIFHSYLGVPASELRPLSTELFGWFARAETFVLFPGAVELVTRARERGLRVGVISNWSARLPALLATLGLARLLDVVQCSAIARLEKPDPAIFRRALDEAGVAAHEALHAGDDLERDLLGARHAGLHAVLVDHAGQHAEWGARYGPRVTRLAELAAIVERMAG